MKKRRIVCIISMVIAVEEAIVKELLALKRTPNVNIVTAHRNILKLPKDIYLNQEDIEVVARESVMLVYKLKEEIVI